MYFISCVSSPGLTKFAFNLTTDENREIDRCLASECQSSYMVSQRGRARDLFRVILLSTACPLPNSFYSNKSVFTQLHSPTAGLHFLGQSLLIEYKRTNCIPCYRDGCGFEATKKLRNLNLALTCIPSIQNPGLSRRSSSLRVIGVSTWPS